MKAMLAVAIATLALCQEVAQDSRVTVYITVPEAAAATVPPKDPISAARDLVQQNLAEELRRKRKVLAVVARAEAADCVVELKHVGLVDQFFFVTEMTLKAAGEEIEMGQTHTDPASAGRLLADEVEEWVRDHELRLLALRAQPQKP